MKAQSKIGSLENVKHRPGGGDKKIFDDKDYLRQMSGCTSKAGSEGIPSGSQVTYNQRKYKNWASSETLTYTTNNASSKSVGNVTGTKKASSETLVNTEKLVLSQSNSTDLPESGLSKFSTGDLDLDLVIDSPTDSFYNSPSSSANEDRGRDHTGVNNYNELNSDVISLSDYDGFEILPENNYPNSRFDVKPKEFNEKPPVSDSCTEPIEPKRVSDDGNTIYQSEGDKENEDGLPLTIQQLPSAHFLQAITDLNRNVDEDNIVINGTLPQKNISAVNGLVENKSHDDSVEYHVKQFEHNEPLDLYDINELFQDNFSKSKIHSPALALIKNKLKQNFISHEGQEDADKTIENSYGTNNEHSESISISTNFQEKQVQTSLEPNLSAQTVDHLLHNFNYLTSDPDTLDDDRTFNNPNQNYPVYLSEKINSSPSTESSKYLNGPNKNELVCLSSGITSSCSTESCHKENISVSNGDAEGKTNNKESLFGSALSMKSNFDQDKMPFNIVQDSATCLSSKKLETVPKLLKIDDNENIAIISSNCSELKQSRSVDLSKLKAKCGAIVFPLGHSSLVIYKNEAGNEVLQIFKNK